MNVDPLAVVTGGSRGIGRGVVLELARLGYEVVVHYRSDTAAAETTRRDAEILGSPHARAVAADLSDPAAIGPFVDGVFAGGRQVDVWVNNAGVAPERRLDLLETTPESWDRVLDTNLRGPFFLTQAVARRMIRPPASEPSSEVGQAPLIVFITSVSSTFASVNRGEYCVSKAGLSMVAQLFAVRLAEHGIRVHEIRPGIIATDMTQAVRGVYDERIVGGLTPIARWGQPKDVGRAVAALASGAFPFSTGEVFHVDGGLNLRRL